VGPCIDSRPAAGLDSPERLLAGPGFADNFADREPRLFREAATCGLMERFFYQRSPDGMTRSASPEGFSAAACLSVDVAELGRSRGTEASTRSRRITCWRFDLLDRDAARTSESRIPPRNLRRTVDPGRIKNGTDGDLSEPSTRSFPPRAAQFSHQCLKAYSVIRTRGNPNGHLVLSVAVRTPH